MKQEKPPTGIAEQGDAPYEEEFRDMGKLLHQDARQIMDRWFERATEEQVHADTKERGEVMNDLLNMVRTIGTRLETQSLSAFEDATEVAREHGQQRANFGWGIVNLVKDYEILHGVLLEHFGKIWTDRLTYRQSAVLVAMLDGAIGSAVEAYNESVNRKLTDLIREQRVALRQLTFDLTEAEHRERHRIARILHDELQQLLVAARMKLEAAHRSPPDPSSLEAASQLLDQVLHISRNATADLHPPALENQPLPAALEWLAETFPQRFGLNVTVEQRIPQGCHPGPMPWRRLVYDAVRELLFNVVKHAKTDQAWLTVRCDGNGSPWIFEIQDRGIGFSSEDAKKGPTGETGQGLTNMRRRIREIGGNIRVDSKPGHGTRITLTVPLTLP